MSDFQTVCSTEDLVNNSGVAALVDGVQVAIFYVAGDVYALSNFDPVGEANVMSRGLVGDIKGELMVASPLQKNHYSLLTGVCLDNDSLSLARYEAKIENNQVMVKL